MKAKVKRRPASSKFYWFQGESVSELYNRLYRSIGDNPRLEVRISGEKMTLEIIPEGDASLAKPNPPINDSHICPPQCP